MNKIEIILLLVENTDSANLCAATGTYTYCETTPCGACIWNTPQTSPSRKEAKDTLRKHQNE